MARYTAIVQLGGSRLEFDDHLKQIFKFIYLPLAAKDDVEKMLATLFENGQFQGQFSGAVYILGRHSEVFQMSALLMKLPANNLIYDLNESLSAATSSLLQRKQAVATDLSSNHELTELINQTFFGAQYGLRLAFENIEITPRFAGQASQTGRGELTLKPNTTLAKPTQALNWRMTWSLGADLTMEFWPEFSLNGTGQVQFKLYLIDSPTNAVIQTYNLSAADLERPFQFKTVQNCVFYVTALLTGEVEEFSVRELHLRQARPGHGNYLVNSQMITDEQNKRGQIAVYFDPGNFKPPLNVYFSGFRTAEGFEGAGMMSHLSDGSVPYLLIADERLEGGAFYLGSPAFEDQVVTAIQHYLDLLNFSNDQLVLSGLSMGTTGALYYAARLSPAAVIVGKPLVNLGSIAHHERLERPNGFPTSLDLLLLHEGNTDEAAQKRFNDRFWQIFKAGDFAKTTFAIAYMKQDDYDATAFPELFAFLKAKYPLIKILYQGLEGRHNDNTPGIVKWFLRQYENTMANTFNRKQV
ncbi:accessory Sec system protein Asp2 [Lapidilactobacillus wuchangensis]|uniref:accessory Sec system protein Asp2 n=1 Tax=Lapidilactobacillus wuchangensis TaxID=2486001 RepID=UPI000F7A3844|nr:accessory Sec system protein Asp2 [Lapidilactobacillus wuchangensis]